MDLISLAAAGPIALKLAELTAVSGPAKILVEKVCSAMGTLYEPLGKVFAAHADVQVDKIKAFGQLDLTTALQQRTFLRMMQDQERIQSNVESIAAQAAESLTPDAKPEELGDDWVANVVEKCKNVSDSDMQSLWAKILAGEANKKRSFSKHTVQVVADLEKEDAVLFTKVCGYVWYHNTDLKWYPLVFSQSDQVYQSQGINYSVFAHLQSLGLLNFNPLGYTITFASDFTIAGYRGKPYRLSKSTAPLSVDTGHVLLTTAGAQLAQIAGSVKVPGFAEYVIDKWKTAGYIVEEKNDSVITSQGEYLIVTKEGI